MTKAPYAKPALQSHGEVRTLTLASSKSGPNSDGQSQNSMN